MAYKHKAVVSYGSVEFTDNKHGIRQTEMLQLSVTVVVLATTDDYRRPYTTRLPSRGELHRASYSELLALCRLQAGYKELVSSSNLITCSV